MKPLITLTLAIFTQFAPLCSSSQYSNSADLSAACSAQTAILENFRPENDTLIMKSGTMLIGQVLSIDPEHILFEYFDSEKRLEIPRGTIQEIRFSPENRKMMGKNEYAISSMGSTQNVRSNWGFGIGIGVNSPALKKNIHFNQESKYSVLQGNLIASYRLGKHEQLIGGLGITYAHYTGIGKNVDESKEWEFNFTSLDWLIIHKRSITTFDTLTLDCLLLDIPLYLRIHVIGENNPSHNFINPYFDLGFCTHFSINKESWYGQQRIERFDGDITDQSYSSDKPSMASSSLFFAVGIKMGNHISIAYSFERITKWPHKLNLNIIKAQLLF